jgi:hypothetical protein
MRGRLNTVHISNNIGSDMTLTRPALLISLLTAFILCFQMACGDDEEPVTAERILAEKLKTLIEAQPDNALPVKDQEVALWEAKIRKMKEETSDALYQQFTTCMDEAEVFKDAEDCFLIIDPQDEQQTGPPPKGPEAVCASLMKIADQEGLSHRAEFTREYCIQDMQRLGAALTGTWASFAECAVEAPDTRGFDACKIAALPSPDDHCSRIKALKTSEEMTIHAEFDSECTDSITSKRSELGSINPQIDLSCCLLQAQRYGEIEACMNLPRCSPK